MAPGGYDHADASKLWLPDVVGCWSSTARIPEWLGAHDTLRRLASVGWLSAVRARLSARRHIREISDWAEITELALGDSGVTACVERLSRSYLRPRSCAVVDSPFLRYRSPHPRIAAAVIG